jgi:hypothetical protein
VTGVNPNFFRIPSTARTVIFITVDVLWDLPMDCADSEARVKLALRVLDAMAVQFRFPDGADSEALRSIPGFPPGMALDEIACEVIVQEVRRMRQVAQMEAREALHSGGVMALEDCA